MLCPVPTGVRRAHSLFTVPRGLGGAAAGTAARAHGGVVEEAAFPSVAGVSGVAGGGACKGGASAGAAGAEGTPRGAQAFCTVGGGRFLVTR